MAEMPGERYGSDAGLLRLSCSTLAAYQN